MRRAVLLFLLLGCVSVGQAPVADAPVSSVTLRREPGPSAGVQRVLDRVQRDVKVTLLVRDVRDGRVLESLHADAPMIPASALKTVTGAAVLVERQGAQGWWSTELTVPAADSGRAKVKALTLRGSADPTLSIATGRNSLRELARQAFAAGVREVGEVRFDQSRLDAASFLSTWYEAAMPAVRLSEWMDAPRDPGDIREALGRPLIVELRRAGIKVRSDVIGPAPVYRPYQPPVRKDEQGHVLPPDPVIPLERRPEQGVASVRSGSVVPLVWAVLRPSDNRRAEELLATLGAGHAGGGTLKGALARERALLEGLGVNLSGVVLADGSGLGRESRLTARALTDLLKVMYDLPYATGRPDLPERLYRQRQNAFVEALPLAGTGERLPDHGGRGGTMATRLLGSGLDVRAKTGTLPGVSSLTGYVTARSGRVLTFAILMNGPDTAPLLTLRDQQDQLVRAIAAGH
ncbi:D-alanyl-D-alanine carboxypeptidase/D-alanyl-D-alanine-endopeptidase [Deinococcus cavernae]|uniref:D-alanyl-D-alanine carboxypeptidase/D-alanyl-D-alanine-endopeptidase n=1 Tax=Deinococcus cavernae TaxID=2320857 RepID=UPI0018F4D2F9|nr:D-alanyl-D-alanine carboxypeptidase [Deinococcus cavernae]